MAKIDLTACKKTEIFGFLRLVFAAEGLTFLGVVGLGPEPEMGRYRRWIGEGRHAGMDYMARNLEVRSEPSRLLTGARAAVLFGLPYFQGDTMSAVRRSGPRVAQYARMRDYHKIIWRRGEAVAARLNQRFGPGSPFRVVTDSAPVLERSLAVRGGGGFIGKNTCLIRPGTGSWLLLGEILTTLDLSDGEAPATGAPAGESSPPQRGPSGGCGTCRRCQVHCPTGALDQDYRLDARKCLSYWTIEHRGVIPEEFWPWIGRHLFGCDVCQLVCPYNRGATDRADPALVVHPAEPDLAEMALLTPQDYERRYGGTPMTRAKREGLIRNALIAMCIQEDGRLSGVIATLQARGESGVIADTIGQIRLRTRTDDRSPQPTPGPEKSMGSPD